MGPYLLQSRLRYCNLPNISWIVKLLAALISFLGDLLARLRCFAAPYSKKLICCLLACRYKCFSCLQVSSSLSKYTHTRWKWSGWKISPDSQVLQRACPRTSAALHVCPLPDVCKTRRFAGWKGPWRLNVWRGTRLNGKAGWWLSFHKYSIHNHTTSQSFTQPIIRQRGGVSNMHGMSTFRNKIRQSSSSSYNLQHTERSVSTIKKHCRD
jgi:hypothetical protein